jgi:molybdopterin molybdotransferase
MLLSEQDALEKVLEAVSPTGTESVSIWEGIGRVLACDPVSTIPIPRFDNSSMDGYAVRAVEAQKGSRLKVVGEQAAGLDARHAVAQGTAIRIFTGAPIPAGADGVIMQEDVERDGIALVVKEGISPGENIRRKGGDLCEGQRMLDRGTVLMGPQLALLASQGIAEIEVVQRPRVAVVATGTELRTQGQPLADGEIYETNRILLSALTADSGAIPHLFDVVPDRLESHLETLEIALKSDVLIVAGGVSVGEKDLVKSALTQLGVNLQLWRVAIRPGKPFLFGRYGRTLVFGLPGNPVSAFVTFLMFVRPALLRLAGRKEIELPRQRVRARSQLSNSGDRPHYLRGYIDDEEFVLAGNQQSHALFTLARASALCRLEPGQSIAAQTEIEVVRFIF